MIVSLLRKIQFYALKAAARNVLYPELDAVDDVSEELKSDEEFLRKVHHALFEIHVLEGALVCPESGRRFPIKDGTESRRMSFICNKLLWCRYSEYAFARRRSIAEYRADRKEIIVMERNRRNIQARTRADTR
jgi:uncharacterized protein YbaR (Trm112 family)